MAQPAPSCAVVSKHEQLTSSRSCSHNMATEVSPTTLRTIKIRFAIFLSSVDWQAFASCYPIFPCLQTVSGIFTPQSDPILLKRLVLGTDPILWIRSGQHHQIHPELSGSLCMWGSLPGTAFARCISEYLVPQQMSGLPFVIMSMLSYPDISDDVTVLSGLWRPWYKFH